VGLKCLWKYNLFYNNFLSLSTFFTFKSPNIWILEFHSNMQSPLIQCFGIPHAKQIDSQSEISFQGFWRKHSMFDSVKWKVSCDYDRLKLTLTEGRSNATYSFINAEKKSGVLVLFLRGKVPTIPSKFNPLSAEFSCHVTRALLFTHFRFPMKTSKSHSAD